MLLGIVVLQLLGHDQPLGDHRESGRDEKQRHARNRFPSAKQIAISSGAAIHQTTIPSGIGPTFPIPHPPRFDGVLVLWTYLTIAASCASVIWLRVNFGIRYGPIRTASATS